MILDTLTDLGNTIELGYWLAFFAMIVMVFAAYLEKVSWTILIGGFLGASLIAWGAMEYTALVMGPVGNAIWYGYDWTLGAYLGVMHLATTFILVLSYMMNLAKSDGKIGWA